MSTLVGDRAALIARLADRAPRPGAIAQFGLGAMVLLAGVHKLLDPTAWTIYVAPWLEPFIVLSPTEFMLANGWLEIGFGLALLLDRYVASASLVAAVSLTATTLYLAVVWVLGGQFGDVVARDVGLAGLAWAVFIGELQRRTAS